MKKIFTLLILVITFYLPSNFYAQSSLPEWKLITKDYESIEGDKWDVNSIPLKYQAFNLNIDSFFLQIKSAPSREFANSVSGIVVDFPTINGDFESYEVYNAPVLAHELQAELPNVRSFIGKSIRNKNKTIRFSVSVFGLKAIILNGDEGTQYIDCITKDRQSYIMYFKSDIDPIEGQINCLNNDESVLNRLSNTIDEIIQERNANDGLLRDYRLALACTEEFSDYYVGILGLSSATDLEKKDGILNVMNDFMTRVNAVYENDLSLTMTIVPNNRNVIFLEDTFLTNDDINTLINESQTFIDVFAGTSNYDIGHMLSTSGSGLAQVNSPCTSNKARGVSGGLGGGAPIGIVYENVILHEMGHQYGARHTYNSTTCAGPATASSAYEPGGGTTIMSYAGICGNTSNIQPTADTYFHQRSLVQMWSNINNNSNCAQQTTTGNDEPTSNAGENFIIPIATPYKLVGLGTDPQGMGSLTYCWEQYDLGPSSAFPTTTTTEGPLVRSFPPSMDNTRYIPRLVDYVSNVNTSTQWEKLVFINRDITYRLTVRDNDLSGGQTAVDEMTVTVTNTSGPFNVTSQNANGISYEGNSIQTITWNVGNTNSGLINEANVNILLSTDGGLNFDTVLLANTPNDGSEDVVMANVNSTTCRIMVEAANNIFYNVNSNDFEIQESLGLDENSFEDSFAIYPNPNSGRFNIKFNANVNAPVKVQVYDIRGRAIFENIYSVNNDFNETINLATAQSGVYLIDIISGENRVTKKVIVN